jgi:hypothetical protein
MTDQETIDLLRKVDDLRAELRRLEPILNKACVDYGKRRGCTGFRDFHVRNDVARAAQVAA